MRSNAFNRPLKLVWSSPYQVLGTVQYYWVGRRRDALELWRQWLGVGIEVVDEGYWLRG